jgi:hypothetical protein
MTAPQPATLDREKDKLFVTDAELLRRLGVPTRLGKRVIAELDRDWRRSGFPQKQKLWGDAECFVESMKAVIAALERDGKEDEACHLRVWCLMPWEASIRNDDSGDLWSTCEICGEPIKEDNAIHDDGGCTMHTACVDD